LDFELAEEHRMLKDLVARFVRDELMPLETKTLAREADGRGLGLDAEDHKRLDEISRSLGLWGLDAPEDIGGSDLPALAMSASRRSWGAPSPPTRCRPTAPTCAC
jgi:acyl-CoA dehydrogenase